MLESLFTNERTNFHGRYYDLTEAMNNPKPVQRPLPLCIGGMGKRRTLPLVARYAHTGTSPATTRRGFAECRDVLLAECDKIGRDPSQITFSSLVRYEGDADAMRRNIDAMAAVGSQLSIISVPKSEPPSVTELIAEAIAS